MRSFCQMARNAALGALLLALLGGARATAAATAEVKPGQVTIRNDYYRYVFDTSRGLKLKELYNRFTDDNNIKDPGQLHLGVIDTGDERMTLDVMTVLGVSTAEPGQVVFNLQSKPAQCQLAVAYDETPETRWTLSIKNITDGKCDMKVIFPLLSGLVPGPSLEQTWFQHGLNGQMIGRQPVHLCGMSGYSFPVMDVFNKKLGGVYLISEDPDQHLKGYELIKKEPDRQPRQYSETSVEAVRSDEVLKHGWGCGMAVVQGVHPVGRGGAYQTPPVVIGVHPGRWEKAWQSYRRWLRSVTRPRSDNNPRWWREVYVSKAIHQQHYWVNGRFDWSSAIKPFDRNSYFDVNHWMDNRGDYNLRQDQGGPAAWQVQLAALRAKGIHSAFYFEACLVNPLSKLGLAHPDWAVMTHGVRHQQRGEPDRPESREYLMCPGSPWRQYLAKTVDRVLRETDVDAIYLDGIGLGFHQCDDPAHPDPPGEGCYHNVGLALELVDDAIDKVKANVPLYSEFYSSDINSQYMNGSYCPFVVVAHQLTDKGFDFCRTGTSLFRFYFPKFKLIEICDFDDKNVAMALFNGQGTHEFFTRSEGWPYLQQCARIWEQNAGAFVSDEPEALLETGNDDLFMNRFPDGKKTLYTLWNGTSIAMTQTPLVLPPRADRHYVELFTHREFQPRGQSLLVNVPVQRVAIVAEMPPVLKVEAGAGGQVAVSCHATLTRPSLMVYGKLRDRWLERAVCLPAADKKATFVPGRLFGGQPITGLSIALLDGKELVDERPLDVGSEIPGT